MKSIIVGNVVVSNCIRFNTSIPSSSPILSLLSQARKSSLKPPLLPCKQQWRTIGQFQTQNISGSTPRTRYNTQTVRQSEIHSRTNSLALTLRPIIYKVCTNTIQQQPHHNHHHRSFSTSARPQRESSPNNNNTTAAATNSSNTKQSVSSATDAATSSSVISGVAPEITLKCVEFKHNSANRSLSISHPQTITKSTLAATYDLQARDLRNIDTKSQTAPYILVRRSTILLNLFQLRLLIQPDRVLILESYGLEDETVRRQFIEELKFKFQITESYGLPFELRVVEAALVFVTSKLEKEFEEEVAGPARATLHALEHDDNITRDEIRDLLRHFRALANFEQKPRLVRDAIGELLNVDEDLAGMYLTDRRRRGGVRRDVSDHQEVEMLLEIYFKQLDELAGKANDLLANIRKTEETINSVLDAVRNEIMLLDIRLNVGMLAVAASTLVAGLYGMNLVNGLEDSPWGFPVVTAFTLTLSLLVLTWGARRLRTVQTVKLFPRTSSSSSSPPR